MYEMGSCLADNHNCCDGRQRGISMAGFIGFILGLFSGSFVTLFAVAMVIMASDADDMEEKYWEEKKKNRNQGC